VSESDVREGLRAAVDGEPPLSFDPDALMAQANRDLLRRRALVGVGVATTAVAVAAVAVPVLLGSPRGGAGGDSPQVGTGSPPSSCPSPSAWFNYQPMPGAPTTRVPVVDKLPKELNVSEIPASPCASAVAPPTYTAAQLTARGAELQAYLRTQFGKVVPAAKDVNPQPFGGEQTGSVSDGQNYLNAFTTFTVNGEPTGVDIYLSAAGSDGPKPCLADARCEAKPQQDGSLVVIEKHDDGPRVVLSVSHFRVNGSVVRATGYSYDPTNSEAKFLGAVPVTVEQLTALATDSKLSL
jgi:hypothetical protein